MKPQADAIKDFILKNVERNASNIVAVSAKKFKVTRTTIHRHIKTLLKQNKLIKSGTTRNTIYVNPLSFDREFSYKITPEISEFRIFSK